MICFSGALVLKIKVAPQSHAHSQKRTAGMTDSLYDYCQTLRSETFVHGFLPNWLSIRGPVIDLTLPFFAENEARKLVASDPLLKSYQWNVHVRSEEHTSELQSRPHLVCRLLLEKKK